MNRQLPPDDRLDISLLSQLFRKTATSYKYVFFQALLSVLKDRDFRLEDPIHLDDLVIEMLVIAWFPHTYFRLSFGVQDQIGRVLDVADAKVASASTVTSNRLRKSLSESTTSRDMRSLKRFVPYRLLSPFFGRELAGVKGDHPRNATIRESAVRTFDRRKPLYKFDETGGSIVVHPEWGSYFREHFKIISGWAAWEWAEYMQTRNPNTPGITRKLFRPQERRSLQYQREFWECVMRHMPLRCIYTLQPIRPSDRNGFALDHFLPWKFVVHDQLWNLVPVGPHVNSSKQDSLPPRDSLRRLAGLQCRALETYKSRSTRKKWSKAVDSYVADLKVDEKDLLDFGVLSKAYEQTVGPLLSIASNQGFPNWEYEVDDSYKPAAGYSIAADEDP